MNRRYLVLLLVLLVLLGGCGKRNNPVETTVTTTEASEETIAIKETIPGIEDSEFDDYTVPTEAETQPETTVATEAAKTNTPAQPNAGQTQNTGSGPATTKPTEPAATEPKPTESAATEPKPTESAPTEHVQPEAKPESEYERFQNSSAAQQQEHMNSFESMDDFFNWYNDAKAEHEAANPPIDVGDGSVDMGELMG